jgi:predicted PurR-regulated permease PerM
MSENPSNPETSIIPPSMGVSEGIAVDPGQRIFRRRVVTFIGIGTLVVVLLLTGWVTISILLLVFLSILIALVIRSLMKVITHRTSIKEKPAFAIVLVGVVLVTTLLVLWLGPQVESQLEALVTQLPASEARLREELGRSRVGQFVLDQLPSQAELENAISGNQASLFSNLSGFFSSTFGFLTNLLVVIFVALYFAFDPHIYTENFLRLFPIDRRPYVRDILSNIAKILVAWLVSRFFSMLFVGVATTIGLYAIGTPLALILGIVNGLLGFIPTFGPIVATVPAGLIALLQSPQQAIYVVLLYIIVQQIDNFFVTPILQQRAVNLPAALTIVTQLLLGVLVGFMGLLLAAPLTAAAIVLIRMLYVEEVLHDYSANSTTPEGSSPDPHTGTA